MGDQLSARALCARAAKTCGGSSERALARGRVRGYRPSELVAIAPGHVRLRQRHGQPEVLEAVIVQVGGMDLGRRLESFGIALQTKHGDV